MSKPTQRVPNTMNINRPTKIHLIIKMSKVKDKDRILKAVREKQLVTYKGATLIVQLFFQQNFCRLEGIGNKYSK